MFVALTMNVSILSLRRHSDPGEIFPATVTIKVQLVANAVPLFELKNVTDRQRRNKTQKGPRCGREAL